MLCTHVLRVPAQLMCQRCAPQIWYGWNIAVLLNRTFIIPKVRMPEGPQGVYV